MQRRKLWALELLILVRSSLCGMSMKAALQLGGGGAKFLDSLIQERPNLRRLLRPGCVTQIRQKQLERRHSESHNLEKIGNT